MERPRRHWKRRDGEDENPISQVESDAGWTQNEVGWQRRCHDAYKVKWQRQKWQRRHLVRRDDGWTQEEVDWERHCQYTGWTKEEVERERRRWRLSDDDDAGEGDDASDGSDVDGDAEE